MPHTHTFSDTLFSRIQNNAIPLVDGLEDVISRALDALESMKQPPTTTGIALASSSSAKAFDPASAPSLTYATLLSLSISGKEQTGVYWSTLMNDVIREAGKKGVAPKEIMSWMDVPAEIGKSDHYSYTYIPEANISVQGQNANRAWAQAHKIAKEIELPIGVTWVWQDKDKAHMPGVRGAMKFNG